MVYASFLWLAWLASCIEALSPHQDAAIVTIPIQRVENGPSQLRKRTDVYRPDISYTAVLALGNPPQQITVQMDTTIGYLMVTAYNSSYCNEIHCLTKSFLDISSSSTYKDLGRKFNITTPSHYNFQGTFATETLTVNGELVSPKADIVVNFGSNLGNIVGMGYVADDSDSYTGFLQSLVDIGKLKLSAYSLYMKDNPGERGTIVLGGVNTAKYTGNLYTMPLPAVNGTRYLPSVLVTGIGITGINKTHSSGLPVYAVLNPGMSATYLPDSIVEDIYNDFGAWFDPVAQMGMINCTERYRGYNLTFGFTDFNISVPLADFITMPRDPSKCEFALLPSGKETAMLGDTFMHRAYTFYDFSHNEISMAQTDFNSDPDTLTEIQAGGLSDAIPDVISVSVTASAPVPTTMFKPYVTDFPLTDSPSDSPSTSSASSAPDATSTSTGGGVGPTGSPHNVMAGLIGAGLLLAL
ncbi:hypothetical protein N7457_006659 [Penicillium paradoxum]|uniref:uncharacterized protein n=1 Tax=Penicillium paradoxum TaxID=176176 RepID=UPI0025466A8C|nr:uncharacterized protein N7457_006659 [Penicillium paradoxum]KAJ5778939.1 hypothetical protein N7457_006659 [Penicillium paradoxum]